MPKKKTHEEFCKQIKELVGDEYTVIGRYISSKVPVKMRHNCNKCDNYEWSPISGNFISHGQRCPKCAGNAKKTHEKFVQEIFDLVGNEYTVIGKYVNTNTNLLIKHNCNSCNNYKWPVKPSNFLFGGRCPKCANKVKRTTEQFIQEVKDLVEDKYTVLGEYINTNTKILMQHNCEKCNNHKWEIAPDCFLNRNIRCPVCANDVISQKLTKSHSKFIDEVFDLVGKEYDILSDYKNTHIKIKIRHNSSNCNNYEYEVTPHDFLQGKRCTKCNESTGEQTIRKYLENNNIKFEKEYIFDNLIGIGGNNLRFDFAIFEDNNLISLCEFQGKQHYEHAVKWMNDYEFNRLKKHDQMKRIYCEQNNIKLIEIPYWEQDNIKIILHTELRDLITN